MIYRAVVEGGSEDISKMDSFFLFFESSTGAYQQHLESICSMLLGDKLDLYDVYNVESDWELAYQSADSKAFSDCHLIESGFSQGKPRYISAPQCLIFLVQASRQRVLDALAMVETVNE